MTRDELIDLLWPDESSERLGARLSVQLSAVRRVLHGRVIADRSTVRLDVDDLDIDIERWCRLDDDETTVAGYAGEFLPDDRYDDWSAPLRDELRSRFVRAARGVVEECRRSADHGTAESVLRRLLDADRFDEAAHVALLEVLCAQGRLGDARSAHDGYVAAMAELDVEATPFDDFVG